MLDSISRDIELAFEDIFSGASLQPVVVNKTYSDELTCKGFYVSEDNFLDADGNHSDTF